MPGNPAHSPKYDSYKPNCDRDSRRLGRYEGAQRAKTPCLEDQHDALGRVSQGHLPPAPMSHGFDRGVNGMQAPMNNHVQGSLPTSMPAQSPPPPYPAFTDSSFSQNAFAAGREYGRRPPPAPIASSTATSRSTLDGPPTPITPSVNNPQAPVFQAPAAQMIPETQDPRGRSMQSVDAEMRDRSRSRGPPSVPVRTPTVSPLSPARGRPLAATQTAPASQPATSIQAPATPKPRSPSAVGARRRQVEIVHLPNGRRLQVEHEGLVEGIGERLGASLSETIPVGPSKQDSKFRQCETIRLANQVRITIACDGCEEGTAEQLVASVLHVVTTGELRV